MYDMTKSVKSVSVVKIVDEVVPILFFKIVMCGGSREGEFYGISDRLSTGT